MLRAGAACLQRLAAKASFPSQVLGFVQVFDPPTTGAWHPDNLSPGPADQVLPSTRTSHSPSCCSTTRFSVASRARRSWTVSRLPSTMPPSQPCRWPHLQSLTARCGTWTCWLRIRALTTGGRPQTSQPAPFGRQASSWAFATERSVFQSWI